MREVREEIDEELAAREEELIDAAKRAEDEYKAERDAAKARGERVGPFDHDRAAELPPVEERAGAIGAEGQYLVYRFESAGVHWQAGSLLHLFSEGGDLWVPIIWFGPVSRLRVSDGVGAHACADRDP